MGSNPLTFSLPALENKLYIYSVFRHLSEIEGKRFPRPNEPGRNLLLFMDSVGRSPASVNPNTCFNALMHAGMSRKSILMP